MLDLMCNSCDLLLPDEGNKYGLFRLNRKHVFKRELLDSWVWGIFGNEGTFLDSFFYLVITSFKYNGGSALA